MALNPNLKIYAPKMSHVSFLHPLKPTRTPCGNYISAQVKDEIDHSLQHVQLGLTQHNLVLEKEPIW